MTQTDTRYDRQIRIAAIGEQGQARLSQARVLCVGAGGLGSAMLCSLACAGVGRIGIVDDDRVSLSNLNRQFLYTTDDSGSSKAVLAVSRLKAINPEISVIGYSRRCDADTIESLIDGYDVVVDCGDNHHTSLLLNDWSYYLGKVFVFASISQFSGMIGSFDSRQAPCLRCWNESFPQSGQDCSVDGILGSVSAIFGAMQANEVIKAILGQPLTNKLVLLDSFTWKMHHLEVAPVDDCPTCQQHRRPAANKLETDGQDCNPQDWMIIDIRPTGQAMPGIARLDSEQVLTQCEADWDDQQKVLLVCHKGIRSLTLAMQLRELGFSQVYSLSGGAEGDACARLMSRMQSAQL